MYIDKTKIMERNVKASSQCVARYGSLKEKGPQGSGTLKRYGLIGGSAPL